jgi:membrane protein YdbS with pleckstrin-like domain
VANLTQQGIAAMKDEDNKRARQLLHAAVEQNPEDVKAWLWLSGAVKTNRERAICLQKVLRLDPDNATAARGVAQMVARGDVYLKPQEEPQSESAGSSQASTESETKVNITPPRPSKRKGFVTRPSLLPWFFGLIASILLFWALFAISGSIFGGDGGAIVRLFLVLGALVVGVRLFVNLLRRLFTRYALTEEHLTVQSGVLSRSRKTIPIHRIQDVTYEQSVLERLLGVGDAIVESAGERGGVGLKDLSEGRRYTDIILDAVHEWETNREKVN